MRCLGDPQERSDHALVGEREEVQTVLQGEAVGQLADRSVEMTAGSHAEALAHVGLDDRGDHLPTELSGGQQQHVAIARAIVKRPRVLLADEPTGNLDESMRDEILTPLESLCAEGITIIVVTHDSAVARHATRRLRLTKGVVQDITK